MTYSPLCESAAADLPDAILAIFAAAHGAGCVARLDAASSVRRREDAREGELMAAYVAGDRNSLTLLFEALAPSLLSFFRRRVRDPAAAEDLLQLTFERVHAARFRYCLGSPVRPWVFTIAARLRIDELRRRFRRHEDLDTSRVAELGGEPQPDGEGLLDQRQRAQRVRRAVDSLPPPQRAVVRLHGFEGKTFAQIGELLGVEEGTARVRAFRAYKSLRTRLSPLSEGAVRCRTLPA